ncbi:10341_t:CDS:1, partial [Cetraspora pellucida]
KEIIQGIKNVIDNWLYSNEKIYEQAIQQELEALCPDKIG